MQHIYSDLLFSSYSGFIFIVAYIALAESGSQIREV